MTRHKSSRKHPTPWRLDPPTASNPAMVDANGEHVSQWFMHASCETSARIVRAVNAYESAEARLERAVVRAVVKNLRKLGGPTSDDWARVAGLGLRVLAARARARKR